MDLSNHFDSDSLHRTVLNGVAVTFVDRTLRDDDRVFCAAVLSGLGYAHDACLDPSGHQHPIPAGAAHLLEHALTSLHLEAHALPIAETGGHLVIRTSADRMVWGVAYANADSDAPHQDIAATAAHLLSMLVDPVEEAALDKRIRHEAEIIQIERAGRRSNLAYRLQVAMMAGLYPGVNLGSDPLGASDFVAGASVADLTAPLNAVRHGVRAITVVADVDDSVIDAVVCRLEPLCHLVGPSRWVSVARPIGRSAPKPLTLVPDPSTAEFHARAAVGVRLRGLRTSVTNRSERAERFLVAEALSNELSMQSSSSARTFASLATIDPPWLDSLDAEELLATHVAATRRRLEETAEGPRSGILKMQLIALTETMSGIVRLAHRADVHDLTLADVFEAAASVDQPSLGDVTAELQHARGAVAYSGPELG